MTAPEEASIARAAKHTDAAKAALPFERSATSACLERALLWRIRHDKLTGAICCNSSFELRVHPRAVVQIEVGPHPQHVAAAAIETLKRTENVAALVWPPLNVTLGDDAACPQALALSIVYIATARRVFTWVALQAIRAVVAVSPWDILTAWWACHLRGSPRR